LKTGRLPKKRPDLLELIRRGTVEDGKWSRGASAWGQQPTRHDLTNQEPARRQARDRVSSFNFSQQVLAGKAKSKREEGAANFQPDERGGRRIERGEKSARKDFDNQRPRNPKKHVTTWKSESKSPCTETCYEKLESKVPKEKKGIFSGFGGTRKRRQNSSPVRKGRIPPSQPEHPISSRNERTCLL